MLDRVKKAVGLKSGSYEDLQKLSHEHCDGELSHEAYRAAVIGLIGNLPDSELTKLAERTMDDF